MDTLLRYDRALIAWMQRHGITILRVSLGIVFAWFGALKLFGVSPVGELIAQTYTFFPQTLFLNVLGVWELVIGIGLIFKIQLRATLVLLWIQMAGTFFSVILTPHLFFVDSNPLILTVFGEFVVKNIVLIASGIVIGGHEIEYKE